MNEELQQHYARYQQLNARLQKVQQQMMTVEQQLADMKFISEGLDDVKKAKEGSEILAPLGHGVFLKTSLKDNKEVLMSIGSGSVVTKSYEEAKQIINAQVEDLGKLAEEMNAELQNGIIEIQHIQKAMQAAQK